MKKLVLILSTITLLSGCAPKYMTNDEIIVEKDKCIKAGMDYVLYESGMGIPYPVRVTCVRPKIVIKSETQSNPEKVEK